MTNTDPRNTYLNPNGIPALIARYEPMISTPQPRPAEAPAPMNYSRRVPVRSYTPSRVSPELESSVPAGRYAIDTPDGVKFYRVDKPVKGNWKGWTFVKVQASDDLHPVRSVAQRTEVLTAIAADVLAASQRYGRELGVCGVCGRTLTDPDSIALGIGPICESKF